MKKRVIFLAMLMGAVLASGCGSQGKQDNTPANTVEVLKESSDGHENEITGVVKEISDSQITLIIGETDRSGGRPGDGDAGNRVDRKMPDADQRRRETEAKPRAGTVRQMKAAVQMEEMPRKEQTAARTERAEIKAGDVVCAKTDAANFALRIIIKSSL